MLLVNLFSWISKLCNADKLMLKWQCHIQKSVELNTTDSVIKKTVKLNTH